MNQDIKALLFDLGGVIINISFAKALARWSQDSGVDADTLKGRFDFGTAYEQHERGEISEAAYFASLRKALGVDLSDKQLEDGWNAIFLGEIPETVALLKRLEDQIPLYAFSNTNLTHQTFWSRQYASALTPFRRIFVSSEIGKRKPEREAFAYVAAEMGVGVHEIMFFDDTAGHVEAARALGIHAVLVKSPYDIRAAVAGVGAVTGQ